MDKFVVRQKKFTNQSGNGENRTNPLKQTKLHQLAGVVVKEEFQSIRNKLSNAETSAEDKVALLIKLGDKKPSKEVLKSTGIGKVVHKLCRDEDCNVSKTATELYDRWKAHLLHIIQRRPIEVESDLQTKKARANSVKMIDAALNNEDLATSIETEVFRKCKRILNCDYTRLTRKAHFAFKNDESLKERACEDDFDAAAFVDDLHKNMIKIYAEKK